MGWGVTAAVIIAGVALAIRVFLRVFDAEYRAAMVARKAINKSRMRREAKMRAKVHELVTIDES